MQNLKVALIQNNILWKDKTGNLSLFEKQIQEINSSVDLILLPETFNTGFCLDALELAEPMDGPSIQWLLSISKAKNAVVAGSLMIKEDGKVYNRFVWAFPNQTIQYYSKRHLFGLGGEGKAITQGPEQITFHLKDSIISPQICYDLRFPVWCRNQGNYDIQVFVANWPETRIDAWKTLLKARAIENQSFVIGLNRTGTDGNNLNYPGDSMVFDPLGKTLLHLTKNETGIVELEMDFLKSVREKLPFLNDRDQFNLLG